MVCPPIQLLQHSSIHIHVHIHIGVGIVVVVIVVVVVVLDGVDHPDRNTKCCQEEGQNEEWSKN